MTFDEQVGPQLMPAGALVTVPLPTLVTSRIARVFPHVGPA